MTLSELTTKLRDALDRRSDLRFALLFGSSVSRGPDSARDVDIAISATTPMSLMDLGGLASDLERIINKPVDIVDVTEANTLLRWEIVRTGHVVIDPDPDALREFRARVPIEYADLRPYLEREAAGLRRALGVDDGSR